MTTPLAAGHFRPAARRAVATLPRISQLAAALADACAAGLGVLRAAPWKVTVDAIAETLGAELNAEGALLRFESDRGSHTAMLLLERPVVSAMIEVAMGGTGTESAFAMQDRPLSKIERGVLGLAQAALTRHVAAALGSFMMRPFRLFEEGEIPDIDSDEALIQFRFVINVFGYSGEITLAFARAELERQLCVAGDEPVEDAPSSQQQLLQREIGKAELAFTVMIGPEMLSLEVIAGLTPGSLVPLAATAGSPVTLWSGGIAAYEGLLGRNGNRLAVTISSAAV